MEELLKLKEDERKITATGNNLATFTVSLPYPVREHMGIEKDDRLVFSLLDDGRVALEVAE
jgi:bifunctional DNA-binding transcriptional regulator/antitoxin component of YhaV-PrlF toxin-antitoxin module